MRKLLLMIAAAIFATALMAQMSSRDRTILTRAEQAVEAAKKLAIDQLITDEVVKAAVRNPYNIRSASWDAREEVFGKHQCPIFAGLGFDSPGSTCQAARYCEHCPDGNYWYHQAGLPAIGSVMRQMRGTLFDIGRAQSRS